MARFIEVNRKADAGELVVVTDITGLREQQIFEVIKGFGDYVRGKRMDDGGAEELVYLRDWQYAVLVPTDTFDTPDPYDITELFDRLARVEQDNDDLRDNLRRFAEMAAQNVGELDDVKESIEDLKQTDISNERYVGVMRKITEVEKKLDHTDDKAEEVDTKVEMALDDIVTLDERTQGVGQANGSTTASDIDKAEREAYKAGVEAGKREERSVSVDVEALIDSLKDRINEKTDIKTEFWKGRVYGLNLALTHVKHHTHGGEASCGGDAE